MDAGAALRIARLTVPEPGARVVEIGGGTGTLTRALVACGAQVTCLEIDPELIGILDSREDLAPARIIAADALTFDYGAAAGDAPWFAGGNLPYYIATPLLMRLLELPRPPARIVAMVQRDVADRLIARAGTPAYGSLSIAVQFRSVVRRAFALGPELFFPRPKVESTVVTLEVRSEPAVAVRDQAFLMQVVRGAFAYRRKTIANSLALSLGIERARVRAALRELNLDAEIRAEQLDLGTFAALADDLGT
jgi:16S rRNA (adenine1518-N6/adenine1519-N6)-dimethyltransferase